MSVTSSSKTMRGFVSSTKSPSFDNSPLRLSAQSVEREPALVVIARGGALSVDAPSVLKQLIAKYGGKGGGKPELAQGGGLAASSDALVADAHELLAR